MWLELLLLLFVSLWLLYKYTTSTYNRWDSAELPRVLPSFPFGSHAHIILRTKHEADVMAKLERKFKGAKCIGMHIGNRPTLAILDLKLAKQILVNDFDHFVNRPQVFFGFEYDADKPSRAKHNLVWERAIFGLKGQLWRNVRSTFSPIFSSSKMRLMSQTILEIQKRLTKELDLSVNKPVELKSKLGKFSMDSIASCAFGVDAESFTNPDSKFVHHARNVFIRTIEDRLKYVIELLPGAKTLMEKLEIPLFKGEESKFFISVIEETLRQRREMNIRRNDLVDLMLDVLKGDSEFGGKKYKLEETKSGLKRSRKELEDILIIATAMIFLVAGYDTTAAAMSFALFELAKNPGIQIQLQEEIDKVFDNNEEGKIDYLDSNQFPFLDQVFWETLRMHPLVPLLLRECTKTYAVPGTNVVLQPGELVKICIAQIHNNETIFEKPHIFDPSRFKKGENNDIRNAMLTFGSGPRNCLGMRFALMESKIGIAHILRQFNVKKCPKTIDKLVLDPSSLIKSDNRGLWVTFERRNRQ